MKMVLLALAAAFLPALTLAQGGLTLRPLTSGAPITLERFRGAPLLVAFWRADCAPCVAEQPILRAVAAEHATLPIAIISLQDEAHTRKAFASVPGNVHVLLSGSGAAETLHALGDGDSAMPYSVFLRADGTTCASRRGLLGTRIVDEWVKRC